MDSPEPVDPADDGDALVDLRAELDGIGEVDVEDRVSLFERVDATLAAELAALDEV